MQRREEVSYQVWARALRAYLDVAELARVPVDGSFDGLSFDAVSLAARTHVPWDEFCTLTERLEGLCGGPERCRELLRQYYHEVLPEFWPLGDGVVCPVSFTRLAVGVVSPLVFQGCAFSVIETGPHRVRIELRLRPGARASMTFFRATIGELEALPRHLGLGPALVEGEISPVHGDYDVQLPAPAGLPAVGFDEAKLVRLAVELLQGGAGSNSPHVPRSRLAQAELAWRLTSRQRVVLEHVVQGASNKEIAQQLECAENTVELHVTQLLRKARVSSRTRLSAAFWSMVSQG